METNIIIYSDSNSFFGRHSFDFNNMIREYGITQWKLNDDLLVKKGCFRQGQQRNNRGRGNKICPWPLVTLQTETDAMHYFCERSRAFALIKTQFSSPLECPNKRSLNLQNALNPNTSTMFKISQKWKKSSDRKLPHNPYTLQVRMSSLTGTRSGYFLRIFSPSARRFSKGCSSLYSHFIGVRCQGLSTSLIDI